MVRDIISMFSAVRPFQSRSFAWHRKTTENQ